MKNKTKKLIGIAMLIMIAATCALTIFAASPADDDKTSAVLMGDTLEEHQDDTTGSKAIAAGICVGLAATGGAVGMGIAIAKSSEGISRQPEAEGKIRTNLMLGLVFIETAIIYALIVAILIIFVL